MNLALRTKVDSLTEQGVLERIPLARSSPVLASGDPRGRSARPSQARWAVDGEEHALCMGKDWCLATANSSQTEGPRGCAPLCDLKQPTDTVQSSLLYPVDRTALPAPPYKSSRKYRHVNRGDRLEKYELHQN